MESKIIVQGVEWDRQRCKKYESGYRTFPGWRLNIFNRELKYIFLKIEVKRKNAGTKVSGILFTPIVGVDEEPFLSSLLKKIICLVP
jgi:hypothetical protein